MTPLRGLDCSGAPSVSKRRLRAADLCGSLQTVSSRITAVLYPRRVLSFRHRTAIGLIGEPVAAGRRRGAITPRNVQRSCSSHPIPSRGC
jgi:hypothetical protein